MAASLPRMVQLPAGSITLRDARTRTSRDVALREFTLAATPVTGAQYAATLSDPVPDGEDPQAPVHSVSWLEAVTWCNAASRRSGFTPAYAIDGQAVTWDVTADGVRLPTEAEWEWACRAGTDGPRYGPLTDVAWTAADRVESAQPVGLKQANAFDLSDMLGNVWEWCWDYVDPARYGEYRTLRGGGWADRHWSVRASVRRGSMPGARLDDVGFRVARGAAEPGEGQAAQGWSHRADVERAAVNGPIPVGWTPQRSPSGGSA